ncbi:uncharacterized protein LOC130960755 [Arachis stenosperma]|uniref:uncharacterized protein LOC130960755 n=1 Tax=Arachis stenosperma TaxID=217475 RepID=UPI0025AD04C7|nr:uncharacterized protein LOC130960755 [Arachis stenosperma]
MEIFSASIRDLWNKWELRVLVLLSMTWQVLLIIFGSRRKYASGSFISALVWFTYLSADWLATVSLGNLANSHGAISNAVALQALWAPFLLLHLGGPDTITAYALEDNTLWLRHFLGLLVQVGVAFYVYLRSWSTSPLTFIAIPVFISGLIKYSERTWVLRFASPAQFEDSLISVPTLQAQAMDFTPHHDSDELEFLHKGYSLFPILKRLYANLSLRFAEGRRSHSLIVKKIEDNNVQQQSHFAFKVVEVQLGFLYDLLYTKAPVIYSLPGLIFRFFSVFSMVSALVAYLFFINSHNYYSDLENLDYYVTLVLFVGAILLEVYALVSLIFSDWTIRWLSNKNKSKSLLQNSIINWLLRQRRWAGKVSQQDLLSFCTKRRVATYVGIDFLFRICFGIELYWQRTWNPVENDLKELIFSNLLNKHKTLDKELFDHNALKELLSFKSNVLRNHNFSKKIKWSIELEFDHCLLVWHVATGVYYYSTPEEDQDEGGNKKDRKMSKMLSDYMMYILLMRPFMLPKWIDRVSHVRDTFREAIKILQQGQFHVRNGADAARMLVQTHRRTYQPLKQLRRMNDKSVLVDGCRLASQLQSLGCSWKMICEVWIEMLTYAANQCEWGSHAQQLRRGGELLTHVRLLMAELGLSEQFDAGMQGPPTRSQHESGSDDDV